jgi:aminomethyltransferase
MAGEPIRDYAPDFWIVSDPDTGDECGYMTSPWWNPDLETNIGLGFVPADKLQAETDALLNDEIYEEDLDIEFEVHLPEEYAEEDDEPVFATVAEVPFKESVNPSARERAKLGARQEANQDD